MSPTAAIVSVLFGLALGWSLGRFGEDRRATLISEAAAVAAGAGAWVLWPGDRPALAAGALLIGGSCATLVTWLWGRRV